jgi:hypothetical protein
MVENIVFGSGNTNFVRQTTQCYQDMSPHTEHIMICPDCNHDYETCVDHNSETRKNIPDLSLTYKLNNYGFRSDDFSIEEAKNNFLFSGCSYTQGTGVPYSMTWAYQFNTLLNKEKLFNIGVSSNNIQISVSNVFEYIKKFGNPSGIFLLLPQQHRSTSFLHGVDYYLKDNHGKYIQTLGDIGLGIDRQRLNLYTQMTSLEVYCRNAKIPLIWGSWDEETSDDINMYKSMFTNYYDMSPKVLDFNLLSNAPKELSDNKYWNKARDAFHFGGKIHYLIAQRFKERWDELYG